MSKTVRKNQQETLGWLQIIGSILAASFGVQSRENRERDFQHGEFGKFVVVALGFTFVLLLTLLCIVEIVISAS